MQILGIEQTSVSQTVTKRDSKFLNLLPRICEVDFGTLTSHPLAPAILNHERYHPILHPPTMTTCCRPSNS